MSTKNVSMTKAQKRVAIAKDTIRWLDGGYFKATTGVYVSDRARRKIGAAAPDSQVSDIVPLIGKRCEVCALGACFLSSVERFNRLRVQDVTTTECNPYGEDAEILDDSEPMRNYLARFFTNAQMALIECAFEGRDVGNTGVSVPDEDEDEGPRYFRKYSNAKRRMKAIMANIVRNKGTFKPSQDL